MKVVLLQGASRILPELAEGLAVFSHRFLEKRGLEIRVDTRIAGATAESTTLQGGEVIPTRTLVSAIRSAPNPLLEQLPCARDRRGRVITDENLAVPGYPGLWAVG